MIRYDKKRVYRVKYLKSISIKCRVFSTKHQNIVICSVALKLERSAIFLNTVCRLACNIVQQQSRRACPRNSVLRNSPLLAAQQAEVMLPAETA